MHQLTGNRLIIIIIKNNSHTNAPAIFNTEEELSDQDNKMNKNAKSVKILFTVFVEYKRKSGSVPIMSRLKLNLYGCLSI